MSVPGSSAEGKGTLGSLWRRIACHMLPVSSAPGHSSLGTQASQAPGCDHSLGHYGLRGIESAFLFIFLFNVFILKFELE